MLLSVVRDEDLDFCFGIAYKQTIRPLFWLPLMLNTMRNDGEGTRKTTIDVLVLVREPDHLRIICVGKLYVIFDLLDICSS